MSKLDLDKYIERLQNLKYHLDKDMKQKLDEFDMSHSEAVWLTVKEEIAQMKIMIEDISQTIKDHKCDSTTYTYRE